MAGEDEAKDRAQAGLPDSLRANSVWRHYKGGIYTIVAVAVKEDTLETLVVYHSNRKGTTWARTLQNFTETVEVEGRVVNRFEPLED